MSNAPFKIAFWVMSLAFGLTILLTGLKPEEIRMALNPDMRPKVEQFDSEDFPADDELLDAASLPKIVVTPRSEALGNTQETAVLTAREMPSQLDDVSNFPAKPVRIASSDTTGRFYSGPPQETLLSSESTPPLVPIPDAMFVKNEEQSREPELKIMVPVPVDVPNPRVRISLVDEVKQLKDEVLRLRVMEARREVDDVRREMVQHDFGRVELELSQLKDQIVSLKRTTASALVDSQQFLTSKPVETRKPVFETTPDPPIETLITLHSREVERNDPPETPVVQPVIEVTPGEQPESFHFQFKNAPVGEVLQTLALHAGRKLVLSPEVTGTFTGNFKEASANQAFAAVIKAHHFGLSFRGDYILVRGQKLSAIR